jgi:hypothetical protein
MLRGPGNGATGLMDWLDILSKFVIPAGVGGAAGFLASWGNWVIEKQRQRLQRRRELVTGWRMELIPLLPTEGWSLGGENEQAVLSSPYYYSLRPHLPEDIIKKLEGRTILGGYNARRSIGDEIARIERTWKLV